jgi:hypothetical protein
VQLTLPVIAKYCPHAVVTYEDHDEGGDANDQPAEVP